MQWQSSNQWRAERERERAVEGRWESFYDQFRSCQWCFTAFLNCFCAIGTAWKLSDSSWKGTDVQESCGKSQGGSSVHTSKTSTYDSWDTWFLNSSIASDAYSDFEEGKGKKWRHVGDWWTERLFIEQNVSIFWWSTDYILAHQHQTQFGPTTWHCHFGHS